MRRFFVVAFTTILLLATLFNISVFAASNIYNLDELELQVTIPSGYSVITRDTPASDPVFSKFGTTKSALISEFETKNIYLNAVSNTSNEEVVVTMLKNDLIDFSSLGDTTLKALAPTLVNQYADNGLNVSKYEIYQHSQLKFMQLYFTDTDKTVHSLQYYTIHDGKAMSFAIRSYNGSLSSKQETTIKAIVDSIKYDKPVPITSQVKDATSFPYTDIESGVTFTVPANWEQKAFTEERNFIDTKFVSTKDDGCTIIYGSNDLWAVMSATDKIGYTRSDLNNSFFTKEDIADMLGISANKIATTTYNGMQYFKGVTTHTTETYGIEISATITTLFCVDNGWGYMFQFGGTNTHKLYSDFESLLKSVQYPTVFGIGNGMGDSISVNNTPNNTNTNNTDDAGIVAVVVLLAIVAIIVIALVISRKKNREIDNSTSQHNTTAPTPESPSNIEPVIYCENCGQALPLDGNFCHKCGTKMFKGNNQ